MFSLDKGRLDRLKLHKYASDDGSILNKLFMNRFWALLINHVIPKWVAPNTLTLAGLVFNAIPLGYLIWACQSSHINDLQHPFVLLLSIICLFMYQTLDALDGLQVHPPPPPLLT